MHIQDIFARDSITFSFEYFPPRTDAMAADLYSAIEEMKPLHPSFVSVTYGAGGATRKRTHDLVVRLKMEAGLDPIPHLTCVCHTEEEIRGILERYAETGISNIMALGGDVPKNLQGYDRSQDVFPHATDLVRFTKMFNSEGKHPDPRGFGIGVAGFPEGHPSTPNRLLEMEYLKKKVEEGADYIVTQLFFDNHDFYDFRERCDLVGINIPILAGIMPLTSLAGMERMAEMALGARFPAGLLRAVERCGGEEEYVRRVGIQWATEQCRDLLDNRVNGLHFYTLNRSSATREVYSGLGVKDSLSLQRFSKV